MFQLVTRNTLVLLLGLVIQYRVCFNTCAVLRHGCSDTRAQGALDAIRNKDGNKKSIGFLLLRDSICLQLEIYDKRLLCQSN